MADERPLLVYNIATDVSPLRASTAASITCVASNLEPAKPVTVYSITITIAVGTTAADLTASAGGIATPDPSGWKAKMTGGVYTAVPATAGAGIVAGHGVRLELDGIQVNGEIGATTVYVDEDASRGAGHPRAVRSTQFTLAKFPRGFTLGSLTAVPDTIQNGDGVSAMWTGTDMPGLVSYKLRWVSQDTPHSADVDWIGPKRIENLDNEPSTLLTLEAHVAGAPPEVRQFSVNVTPRAPVIDTFRGDVIGTQIQLTWSARNATECSLDGASVRLDPSGSATVPLDRFHFVLRAKNRSMSASAELDVQFTAGASVQADTPWVALAPTPDGTSLFGLTQAECNLYDGTTLRYLKPWGIAQQRFSCVAVSPDGQRIVVSAGSVGLWDAGFQVVSSTDYPADGAAFSPDSASLYLVTSDPHGFWLRRFTSQRMETIFEVRVDRDAGFHSVTAVCVTPDDASVFVFSLDSDLTRQASLRRFNAATGQLTGTVPMGALGTVIFPTRLCSWRSGDRVLVAAACDTDGAQTPIDAATLQPAGGNLGFANIALTATELIGERWSANDVLHVDMVDQQTMTTAYTIDIPTPHFNRSPMAVASGVLYIANNSAAGNRVTRYAATSAVRRPS